MSVAGIEARCWIMALFIRDDGQRFLLGDGAYDFKNSQQHFAPNTFANDTVEVQGNDGILLAGQVRRSSTQSFDGYIGDATVPKSKIEQYRRQFISFFRKNRLYTVVYIFPDGSSIQRQRGFIVDAPKVQELYQHTPEYHIALNFEDVNYYNYNENSQGEEIFGETVDVPLANVSNGGLVWDEYGIVWDEVGAVWEEGTGVAEPVMVDGIDTIYPVWVVNGPITNPTLENVTTGTSISYAGAVTEGQRLIVDMNKQTATLNGANVLENLTGDWVTLTPGANRMLFSATSAGVSMSELQWQEIAG